LLIRGSSIFVIQFLSVGGSAWGTNLLPQARHEY